MDLNDIMLLRMQRQHLAQPRPGDAVALVAWMGAVQAQDHAGAVWALTQRLRTRPSPDDLQRVQDQGLLLRTHVLRPTWHLVAATDIRWLLTATAARVHAINATMNRKMGLDAATLRRTRTALARALRGGGAMDRTEVGGVLSGIVDNATQGTRFTCILMDAELEGVLCSGPRRGKQNTYALLDERAPHARVLTPDQALGELALRYFQSHGPASVRDLAWWASLTLREAQRAVELSPQPLEQHTLSTDGTELWCTPLGRKAAALPPSPTAWLLPNYDEYGIAYRNRDALLAPPHIRPLGDRPPPDLPHLLVLDGALAGLWGRSMTTRNLTVRVRAYAPLSRARKNAVKAAAEAHAAWLGLTLSSVEEV